MNFIFVTKQTHIDVHADEPKTYLGAWKSAGGYVSHELLPDGTYVKHKGNRQAATGRYRVQAGRISYETDDGGVYEGEFANGRLNQAGMIFYKVM
jgi:hypothetical protein